MKTAFLIVFFFSLFGVSGVTHALDFKSVGAHPAVLYDTPSLKGRKVFIAPRGMPVEVVMSYGEWAKVRDAAGDLTWIEAKMLVPKKNVVVTANAAKVRATADEAAGVAFVAEKGVLLEIAESGAFGWIKVRHRDGQGGFVKASDVWGE